MAQVSLIELGYQKLQIISHCTIISFRWKFWQYVLLLRVCDETLIKRVNKIGHWNNASDYVNKVASKVMLNGMITFIPV